MSIGYHLLVWSAIGAWGLARRRHRAGVVGEAAARRLARLEGGWRAALVFAAAGTAVTLELTLEPWLREALPWDLTAAVVAVEGHAVVAFQEALRSDWLDWVSIAIYLPGASLLYHVPFLHLLWTGRHHAARRLAATVALLWGVAILFYLLAPVREAWTEGAAGVLKERLPAEFASSSLLLNNVDNNFPSLHVAVSVGIVLALALAGERRAALLWAPLAAGVVFTTIYLGIHWWLDVVAGLALAAAGALLVHRQAHTLDRSMGGPVSPRGR